MTRFLTILCLALVLFATKKGEAADTSTAELLFQRGRAAMVAQDFSSACQLFSESLELDPAVGTLMNLAACEQRRRNFATSYNHWQEALLQLEEDDPRRAFAMEQSAVVDAQVARLTISVEKGTPQGWTILWNGKELEESKVGEEFRVDPGAHLVVVQSRHHEEARYHFPLDRGQDKELVVTVGPALSSAPSRQLSDSKKLRKSAGFAALGVGAVGVAGIIITGALLPGQLERTQDECPNMLCSDEGQVRRDRGKTLLALNTTSWIVAGVSLAAGSALLLTLPLGKERSKGGQPESEKSANSASKDNRERARNHHWSLALGATSVRVMGTF